MSRRLNLNLAVEDVITAITAAPDVAQPDLAIAFLSSAHHDQYHTLIRALQEQLPSLTTIVGCSVSVTCGPVL
jgi:small ligand-binding sensory domain FIST